MSYYIDTSSLLKIYHKETGARTVLNIYNSNEVIIISELARIEFMTAIHRKFRESEINTETLKVLKEKFEFDLADRYDVLLFSSLVVDETISLIKKYCKNNFLRTLDCMQLSFFKTYCEKDDIFVCSDKRLTNIAKKEKYKVLVP